MKKLCAVVVTVVAIVGLSAGPAEASAAAAVSPRGSWLCHYLPSFC